MGEAGGQRYGVLEGVGFVDSPASPAVSWGRPWWWNALAARLSVHIGVRKMGQNSALHFNGTARLQNW
jgi:hypothetical protein